MFCVGFERRNFESKNAARKFTNKKGAWLLQVIKRLYDAFHWGKYTLFSTKYLKRKKTDEEKNIVQTDEEKQQLKKENEEKKKEQNIAKIFF